ncbi:hypothetical protein V491_02022 [Pseudogymnoascus sp. VKM F-3775]|nr:hypothetical protein V491_02022 [Pseudogymnoascus sp. VKM F-3775]
MATSIDPVRAALVVSVSKEDSKKGEPNVFTATQIRTVNSLPEVVPDRADERQDFTWSLGPVEVTGYVDTSTFEIGVEVRVFGAKIFNLFGNLKDGVVGKIDLFLAKGEIRFYLKNGNGTVDFETALRITIADSMSCRSMGAPALRDYV